MGRDPQKQRLVRHAMPASRHEGFFCMVAIALLLLPRLLSSEMIDSAKVLLNGLAGARTMATDSGFPSC